MHTPPWVVFRDTLTPSACYYYRTQVPARTMEKLGLASVMWDRWWEDQTREEKERRVIGLLAQDIISCYATGGKPVETFIDLIEEMGCETKEDGTIVTPPSFFEDLDDNTDWVSPLNPRFVDLGTRIPGHGILKPGESVTIVKEDGERVELWRDGDTNPEGKVFDIAKNVEGMESFDRVLQRSSGVSFTTQRLADYYIKEKGLKNTYVFPNSVIPEDYPGVRLRKEKGTVRVLWQGGDSHYADWYSLKPYLAEACSRFPEVKFVIWGRVFPWIHNVIPARQLEFHEWVPYEAYKIKLAAMDYDINLAPLVDNVFNEGKSAIKWYESSILPTPKPTLASKVPPYVDEMVEGETGLMYSDGKEFIEKLGLLVSNQKLRARLARNAKEWVLGNRHAERTVPPYFEWLQATHAGFQETAREAHMRLVPPPVPGA